MISSVRKLMGTLARARFGLFYTVRSKSIFNSISKQSNVLTNGVNETEGNELNIETLLLFG